jgi:2-C-methyl-D-erythritol 4-phosphate cytidylyltransferase / 2-C-methyl-D-erythritol 2,4-cyclodiphosphate synthase
MITLRCNMHTALIMAAGSGNRTKLNQSKVLYPINDQPLFKYSVDTFLSLNFNVILVVSKKDYESFKTYVSDRVDLVVGGKTRAESVLLGLKNVSTPYVYIHDAARPLITQEAIISVSNQLNYHDAVLLAEQVSSSLKQVNASVIETKDRSNYYLAQTPQAFLTEKIKQAYLKNDDTFDDDIGLYQAFYPNEEIKIVLNNDTNLKVTYPKDLVYVKNYFKKESDMRIGHSFDIHRLVENRPLILGGITIDYHMGLLGHSDADVLLHVVSEAILGALALGDLGKIFPDTDPKFKDISSVEILKHILGLMKNKSYQIVNIDTTIFAEEPKLNTYISRLRENLSSLLNLNSEQVSIKATTYEKLDSIGQKKAIAAEAVVLLKQV